MAQQNGLQSGTTELNRLPLAKMGKGDTHIRRQVAHFRTGLEAAVLELAGKVGVATASRIHTAAVALRRHLQVERRLAKDGAGLNVADWTALADRSVRFKEVVDRALQALGLDCQAKPADPWAIIYNQPQLPASPPAAPDVAEAGDRGSEGQPGALDGMSGNMPDEERS